MNFQSQLLILAGLLLGWALVGTLSRRHIMGRLVAVQLAYQGAALGFVAAGDTPTGTALAIVCSLLALVTIPMVLAANVMLDRRSMHVARPSPSDRDQ